MVELPQQTAREDEGLLPFIRRAFVIVAIGTLVALAIVLRDVLILMFAAIMVGVALSAAARNVGRITRLGHRTSLAIATTGIFILLGISLWFIWPIFQEQLPNLFDQVMSGLGALEDKIGVKLPENLQELTSSLTGLTDQLLAGVVSVFGAVAAAITSFFLVVGAGIFFAAEPQSYRDGLVLMFPISMHGKVRRALRQAGDGLLLWLRAQLLSMATVGVLCGLGAWAIGLPSALALGLIAALGEFVPIIGPVIAFVPAALVALSDGTSLLGWTALLYFAVQQLENNLITPMLQRSIASLPPVLLLFSLVAFGLVFGIIGVIVAVPLTVSLYLLVRELYVRELLGQHQLMGDARPGPEEAKDDVGVPVELPKP